MARNSLRERATLLLQRVASPSSFSVPTWLLGMSPLFLTVLLNDHALYGGSLLAWLMVIAIGYAASGVVLLVASKLLRSRRPPWWVLLIFTLAGVGRGAGVALGIAIFNLAPTLLLPARIISGAMIGLSGLGIAAIIVDGYRMHRSIRDSIAAQLAQTSTQLFRASQTLYETRSQLRTIVNEYVGATVASLVAIAALAQPTRKDLMETCAFIHDAVARVVRPTSHEYSISEPPEEPHTSSGPSVRRAVTDALTVSPFHPAWLAATLFPLMLVSGVRAYGVFWGIAGSAWIWLCAALPQYLAAEVYQRFARTQYLAVRAFTTVIIWLVSACTATIPILVGLRLGIGPANAWPVYGIPLLGYIPLTSLGVAVAYSVAGTWTITERTLEAELASVTWNLGRIEQESAVERLRLGQLLHGTVQQSLTSSALRIERFLHECDDPLPAGDVKAVCEGEIESLTSMLAEVDETFDQSRMDLDPLQILEQIRLLWRTLAIVRLELDSVALNAIRRDSVAAQCVVEIAREAIANAVRHGHATEVSVAMTQSALNTLRLDVADNGRFSPSAVPGMGNTVMRQYSQTLTLSEGPRGGTLLAATVQLDSMP